MLLVMIEFFQFLYIIVYGQKSLVFYIHLW